MSAESLASGVRSCCTCGSELESLKASTQQHRPTAFCMCIQPTPPCRSGWRLGRTGRQCRAHSVRWSCSQRGRRGTSRCRERRCAALRCALRGVIRAPLLGALRCGLRVQQLAQRCRIMILLYTAADYPGLRSAPPPHPTNAPVPAIAPALQLNLGEPELALQSMERVLQLAPGHPEAAAEVASIRALVLQRRQGGGGVAGGQRAHVVPRPADGGGDAMES